MAKTYYQMIADAIIERVSTARNPDEYEEVKELLIDISCAAKYVGDNEFFANGLYQYYCKQTFNGYLNSRKNIFVLKKVKEDEDEFTRMIGHKSYRIKVIPMLNYMTNKMEEMLQHLKDPLDIAIILDAVSTLYYFKDYEDKPDYEFYKVFRRLVNGIENEEQRRTVEICSRVVTEIPSYIFRIFHKSEVI